MKRTKQQQQLPARKRVPEQFQAAKRTRATRGPRPLLTFLFEVPATLQGKRFVESLKRFMNPQYRIWCRGRGFRWHGAHEQDLPISKAERMAVYIMPKASAIEADKTYQAQRKEADAARMAAQGYVQSDGGHWYRPEDVEAANRREACNLRREEMRRLNEAMAVLQDAGATVLLPGTR